MPLKKILDSLDGLDDGVKSFYKESDDGKFRLDLEGDEEDRFRNKHSEAEKHRKNAERERDEYKTQLEEERAKKKQDDDKKARDSGDVEALEKSWQDKLTNRETELTGQIDQVTAMLREAKVNGVASALAAELAVEGSAKALAPHIEKRLGMEMRDGKAVTVVLDEAGKPSALTIDELKTEFSNDKAFAPLLVGSKASGGGAGSGNGGGAPTGNMGGSTSEREAAIAAKYNLPS